MPSPNVFMSEYVFDRERVWSGLDEEERRRQEAMLEVIATESTYYQRLTTLHQVFYHRCEGMITKEERDVIFQNIDELLLRSGLFLADLCTLQRQQKGHLNSISIIFLKHDALCNPQCNNLDMASFLLEPVQRLARYPLLLKHIMHYTGKGHPDHAAIMEAVERSERLLHEINEAVRLEESRRRLAEIQKQLMISRSFDESGELFGDEELELTGQTRRHGPRRILIEGALYKCRSRRSLLGLLLTDMVVLLEPAGSNYLLYRAPYALEDIAARPINPANIRLASGINADCCFEIFRGAQSIFLAAETRHDQQRWLKGVEEARRALLAEHTLPTTLSSSPHQPRLICIGTLQLSLIAGNALGTGQDVELDPYVVVELNLQKHEFKPAHGGHPFWNQSVVLTLSSFDDPLVLSIFNFRKYSPNELLGTCELALDFLEYYANKPTERIQLPIPQIAGAFITVQFHFKEA